MNEDFEEWAQKKVNEAKKRTESKQVAEQVLTDKEALKSQYVRIPAEADHHSWLKPITIPV